MACRRTLPTGPTADRATARGATRPDAAGSPRWRFFAATYLAGKQASAAIVEPTGRCGLAAIRGQPDGGSCRYRTPRVPVPHPGRPATALPKTDVLEGCHIVPGWPRIRHSGLATHPACGRRRHGASHTGCLSDLFRQAHQGLLQVRRSGQTPAGEIVDVPIASRYSILAVTSHHGTRPSSVDAPSEAVATDGASTTASR